MSPKSSSITTRINTDVIFLHTNRKNNILPFCLFASAKIRQRDLRKALLQGLQTFEFTSSPFTLPSSETLWAPFTLADSPWNLAEISRPFPGVPPLSVVFSALRALICHDDACGSYADGSGCPRTHFHNSLASFCPDFKLYNAVWWRLFL